MYDIFYVSKTNGNDTDWATIKSKYSFAQRLTNITSYEEIRSKSFTKMFWVIWDDVELTSFNLLDYTVTKWDDMYVHVFKNSEHYDGICLFPKSLTVSQREFSNRFFTDKKEIDIVASIPKGYNRFEITTYDDYLKAVNESSTEMFWAIWPDVDVDINFKFDYKVPKHNSNIVHIFKNNDHYDGICLFPKNITVSRREFYHRFFTGKKEIDILASVPKKYNVYSPSNYDEYLSIDDEMFWLVWPEVEIIDESVFKLYFSHHNTYDRRENHIFKNTCNNDESYMSGVILCSKYKQISSREFEKQYVIDKKEHDIIASRFRYPTYVIHSYEQYLEILRNLKNKMFWGIWPEIEIIDTKIFDFYFDPNDGKYDHDRAENHVFKNLFRGEETYSNGITLFSTDKKIGKREFDHRFLIKRKEHDVLSSKFKPYDIIFISYNEPNADENYDRLLQKFPKAKRVDKIKGIHQAHIKAAEIANSEMFWAVDGDAVIVEDFIFDYETSTYERDIVHVWQSKNPVNELIYGYGGVKLLPKNLTLEMNVDTPDMTTAISKKFKAIPVISNITAFDTDPFSTWKSAFRECVKLSSRIIDRQQDEETQYRLDVWCNESTDRYALDGANAGRDYGLANKNNLEALKMINDFTWLEEQFDERCRKD